MARWIEVEIENASARFLLQEELAPKTTAALWDALPLTVPLRHSIRSGEACSARFSASALASLPERPELGVASIYRGWMVLRTAPPLESGELLISYGLAEHRTATGRRQVTPVAELDGDGAALFAALRRTHTEGEKTLVLRQVTSQ